MEDTRQVGKYTVHVEHDPYADHPECEGLELVAFGHDFFVQSKDWPTHRSFSDFVSPKHSEVEHISGSVETMTPPVCGPSDPLWRKVYLETTTNQMEVLLAEADEEIGWEDIEGTTAARHDFHDRTEAHGAWKTFREAHASVGCWVLNVRNYGGGNIRLSLGDLFEGGVTDRWGDSVDPDGYVLVHKFDSKGRDQGWHKPLEEVAQNWVSEWNDYVEGECWMYRIVDEDGETVESCGGFIGDSSHCMEAGVCEAESIIRHEAQKETA
jgi:hypothetical protein